MLPVPLQAATSDWILCLYRYSTPSRWRSWVVTLAQVHWPSTRIAQRLHELPPFRWYHIWISRDILSFNCRSKDVESIPIEMDVVKTNIQALLDFDAMDANSLTPCIVINTLVKYVLKTGSLSTCRSLTYYEQRVTIGSRLYRCRRSYASRESIWIRYTDNYFIHHLKACST